MKKSILAMMVLSTSSAFGNTGGKLKPSYYKIGYAKVEAVTEVAGKNGEIEIKSQTLCEGEVKVPVYRLEKDNQEIHSIANFKNCHVKVNGVEATVLVNPIILEVQGGVKGEFIDKYLAEFRKLPQWLKNSFQKPKVFEAYSVSASIVPKGWSWEKPDAVTTTPDDPNTMKIFEIFADTSASSHQTAAFIGKQTTDVLLSTELTPASRFCQENSQSALCSSEYTIKTDMFFKAE